MRTVMNTRMLKEHWGYFSNPSGEEFFIKGFKFFVYEHEGKNLQELIDFTWQQEDFSRYEDEVKKVNEKLNTIPFCISANIDDFDIDVNIIFPALIQVDKESKNIIKKIQERLARYIEEKCNVKLSFSNKSVLYVSFEEDLSEGCRHEQNTIDFLKNINFDQEVTTQFLNYGYKKERIFGLFDE